MLFKLPLKINSLLLSEPTQVIGQEIVFENIPWFNKEKEAFVNALTPFVTQSVIPRPFSNDNLILLGKGLHLHWNLPSILKTFDESGKLPEVPNRWIVIKEQQNKKEEWIIESDYIWNINDPVFSSAGICTYPNVKKSGSGDIKDGFEFNYVGRKYAGTKEREEENNNYLDHLTALGWGSLSFDMHYGNCRSIFGFHDEKFDETADARYSIVGFYSKSKQDNNYFKRLIEVNRIKLKERARGLNLHQMYMDELFRQGLVEDNNIENQESIRNTAESLEIQQNLAFENLNREIDKAVIFDVEHAFRYLINNSSFNAEKYVSYLSESSIDCQEWTIKTFNPGYRQEQIETICCGTFEYKYDKSSLKKEKKSGNIDVSIANTLPEALTSVLLKDHESVEKLVQEEQLEAILNWGELNDKNLDWVSRLRNKRHENQFRTMLATSRWEIVLSDPHHDQSAAPVPPLQIEKKLDVLNAEQNKLDVERNRLYHDLECMYMDWHTYLMSLFVYKREDISNTNIRIIIEKKLLPLVAKTESKIKNLQRIVDNLKKNISSLLGETFILELKDNLNYYEPIAPTVIIYDNNKDQEKTDSSVDYLRNSYKELRKEIYAENVLLDRESYHSIQDPFEKQYTLNAWNTYKIEWEAFFISNKNTGLASDFQPDFLTSNYVLDDQNADLVKSYHLHNLRYSQNPNLYYGSSFVNDTVKEFIEGKLNAFLNSQDIVKVQIADNDHTNEIVNAKKSMSRNKEYLERIKADLSGINLLEISLSDFNHVFTQRTSALNLMPLIPNGFTDHRELASTISGLIKRYESKLNLLTPNSSAQFNPFRNGAFKIDRLRLVDTFGRDKIIHIDKVSTGYHQQIPDKKNWISLPPRLAQPATISGKWENLAKTNAPVLGWLVVNKINNRLEVFNYKGDYLGAFNNEGKWEFSPFEYRLASEVFDADFEFLDENKYLRKTLSWLYSKLRNRKKAIEDLINQIVLTLGNIEPESSHNASLMESISTTPLALTMIHVELFVKGGVFHDLGKESQKKFADSGGVRNDLKHSEVRIPISVGDPNQYNDGCVAYWHSSISADNDDVAISSDLYFNNSERAVVKDLKKIDHSIVELDKVYRINAASVDLATFLEKFITEENSVFISKNDFLKYYIIEGNTVWIKLLENGILMSYELAFTLKSSDLKKSDVNLSEGFKLKNEDHDNFLSISRELRSRSYLLLMHPKGGLFIKSGVLPIKKLEIPFKKIKSSLKRIALTLYTGPVITPKDHFEITLLKDNRYQWSWIELKKEKSRQPIGEKNGFSKIRLTQGKSIDLKKCNIQGFFESLDYLKSFLLRGKIITELKPSLKNNPETYLLLESKNLKDVFDKMIHEYVERNSYEKRWQKFHVNFGEEYVVCKIKGSRVSGYKKELIDQGLIYRTTLFENARYVVVTGKYFERIQNPDIETDLLLSNLTIVDPVERKEVKINNAQLVNLNHDLLTYLNLSLCSDEYLQSELLETDDFFTGEHIYFLDEKKYSEFEMIYNNLNYLNDVFSKENLEKTSGFPNADAVCRENLLKIESFAKVFEAGIMKEIKMVDLQSARSGMIAEGKGKTEILLDFFEKIERLVFRADENQSESIRAKLHEIMCSKENSFMEKLRIHYSTFEFILANKHAVSFMNDFNTCDSEVPEIEMKEGWLSIKSTNN